MAHVLEIAFLNLFKMRFGFDPCGGLAFGMIHLSAPLKFVVLENYSKYNKKMISNLS